MSETNMQEVDPGQAPQQEKPRLSPSKVTSYQTCGYAAYRYYVLGDKTPPGIAAIRGSGVHGGAEVNFKQKIESRQDLPKKEVVDIAVTAFEQKLAEDGVLLTPEEESIGSEKVIGEAKDVCVSMAEHYSDVQAPDYQPVIVEEYYRIPLPNCSHDLSGIIDVVDDKWRVRDFKTAGKKKSQSEADTSFQLHSYALAVFVKTKRKPVDVGLDVAIQYKDRIGRQVLTTTPTVKDFEVLVNRANAVINGFEKGVFLPAPPGHWKCSAKWCGYAANGSCPYYVAERDPTSKQFRV